MARTLRPRLAPLLLAALAVGLDQLSKRWALEHLASGSIQPLLPGLLQLQRVSNTGAAFSLFAGAPNQLGLVSALVSLGLLFWILWRPPAGAWNVLALGLLLGGAVGNGIDRWRHGAVVDFLEFVPIHFPIFNLADVAINLAVACFLIDLLQPHADRHP
ncbi:lipoprotein signal peptidase [Cyanobium sp. Copco_Reservoir_LC18]|uniref:signal peptidase II n=1 Tax=Cyanobium sp. Copco_Reservoir_LC18 TaxID=1328305 RepID=UPI00135C8212|nr:signal peptidase II [Cyanobium sp. Copco_Reservoir_LC18]KAF0653927.1 lipoprotein signal peptidase [Cyanobium sp. Copco_Reservoir_LC18]